jgi:hypothetical protein
MTTGAMSVASVDAPPIAVWDAQDPEGLFWLNWREASAWATEHIRDVNDTYRAEFYLLDAPFVVLHRFAADDAGRHIWDPETESAMLAGQPVVQVLDELPPPHLLGRTG